MPKTGREIRNWVNQPKARESMKRTNNSKKPRIIFSEEYKQLLRGEGVLREGTLWYSEQEVLALREQIVELKAENEKLKRGEVK
jgi:hypothetical protein